MSSQEPKFVSKTLMYEIPGWVLDETWPEFKYMVPVESGKFWIVDCWIVNESGAVHPDYSVAGIPVHTRNMIAINESPFLSES